MFWEKAYTPSQNIEVLLKKENATVEEFLDDDDILQECRSLKIGIISYITRPNVIRRLIELITTEPSEDLPLARRFRYANMASEVLTVGIPSLNEKILSDPETLKILYSYLENEPPLNPLLSSFFNKTFSMLFTKKPEQDWFLYQQTCLQLLEYLKSQNNFLDLMCKHFTTPIIPDLIIQMMKEMEGGDLKRNLYEWLTEERLVERLIAILGNAEDSDKHADVAEFLCDLIQHGRNMRQTEYQNDSFEPAYDGSNPILKKIESEATVDALLNVILKPNAKESTIVSGISVLLMLLEPVTLVDEPVSDRAKNIQQRENEMHEEILENVIKVIAPRLKEFSELLKNKPSREEIVTTAAALKPPFGNTRLQICRIFTVLLQTRSEEISKAICKTDFFETLLQFFKNYCWNNFLHNEVKKCLQLVFYSSLANNNNSTQGSTIANDGSFSKSSNNGENLSSFFTCNNGDGGGIGGINEMNNMDVAYEKQENEQDDAAEISAATDAQSDFNNEERITDIETDLKAGGENVNTTNENKDGDKENITPSKFDEENINATEQKNTRAAVEKANDHDEPMEVQDDETEQEKEAEKQLQQQAEQAQMKDESMQESDITNVTQVPSDTGPTALQTHVIVNCKVISKLIDCWQHNKNVESIEKGRRLGYMGHLIKIFKRITTCISKFEHIGALIENNLSDANELELWQSIVNPNDGDLTKALAAQTQMLANCNAKDYLGDSTSWNDVISPNVLNSLCTFDSSANDILFALESEMYRIDLQDNDDNGENDINLFQFGRNIGGYDDDDDDENAGVQFFNKSTSSNSRSNHKFSRNPWDMMKNVSQEDWNECFANFEAHFLSFTNDLGDCLSTTTETAETAAADATNAATSATLQTSAVIGGEATNESDNNTKNEKISNFSGCFTSQSHNVIGGGGGGGGGVGGGGGGGGGKIGIGVDDGECIGGENEMMSNIDEYDNNANVERTTTSSSSSSSSSSVILDKAAVEKTDDNEKRGEKQYLSSVELKQKYTDEFNRTGKTASSLSDDDNEKMQQMVLTLQSVMQDSEDDYDDDEGMWTKPLGGNSANEMDDDNEEEEEVVDNNDDDVDDDDDDDYDDDGLQKDLTAKASMTRITNGPSKQQIVAAATAAETEDKKINKQLFNNSSGFFEGVAVENLKGEQLKANSVDTTDDETTKIPTATTTTTTTATATATATATTTATTVTEATKTATSNALNSVDVAPNPT